MLRQRTLLLFCWLSLGGGACKSEGPSAPLKETPPSLMKRQAGASATSAPAVEKSPPSTVASQGKTLPTENDEKLNEVAFSLPEGLLVGKPREEPMFGDRPLRVTHAKASLRHAIVYLHGMCGNPKGADPWADIAAQKGTLIVVRATVPCPTRPGYKWPKDASLIQERIDRALDFVKSERGGLLDDEAITLIGYSQGAHRAERVAALSPDRYPSLILGGSPTEPTLEYLKGIGSVAVLGGELEDTEHMEAGSASLTTAGVRSRFFLLPRAAHGGYGPQGRKIMTKVFSWLEGSR